MLVVNTGLEVIDLELRPVPRLRRVVRRAAPRQALFST